MGKLLLPNFAMTKSSLPQTNTMNLNDFRNSNMGALWFSNSSHYSHHHSISEPPIYKLILALYQGSLLIIEILITFIISINNGRNIPYTNYTQNSTAKDQRNYFNYLRNPMLIIKAVYDFEIVKISMSIFGLLLFCKYGGTNSLILVLFGLVFAYSCYAEIERIGSNLRIILKK